MNGRIRARDVMVRLRQTTRMPITRVEWRTMWLVSLGCLLCLAVWGLVGVLLNRGSLYGVLAFPIIGLPGSLFGGGLSILLRRLRAEI